MKSYQKSYFPNSHHRSITHKRVPNPNPTMKHINATIGYCKLWWRHHAFDSTSWPRKSAGECFFLPILHRLVGGQSWQKGSTLQELCNGYFQSSIESRQKRHVNNNSVKAQGPKYLIKGLKNEYGNCYLPPFLFLALNCTPRNFKRIGVKTNLRDEQCVTVQSEFKRK